MKPASPRPNVVLIVVDDLGYGGLGYQGDSQAPTPNIDALAATGVRMSNAYANHPVCAPSRAALMSGRYAQRFGFEFNPRAEDDSAPNFGLPIEEKTLAERLSAAGYATAMFGKWHLGFRPELQPSARGFGTFYGHLDSASAHGLNLVTPSGEVATDLRDMRVRRNRQVVDMPADLTRQLGDEAVAFIEKNRDKPFFVYLPFNVVHAPMQARSDLVAHYASIEDGRRRIHLAQLEDLDQQVGRIVAALKEAGIERNTLILFTSDNGGPTQTTTSSNAPLRGVKGMVMEGGVRVPAFAAWPGRLPEGGQYDGLVANFDFTATVLKLAGVAGERLDGVDLMPFIEGRAQGDARETLFWRSGPMTAMRKGPWKLIVVADEAFLFDVSADVRETRNLAAAEPTRLEAMRAEMQAWENEMEAPRWGSSASVERAAEAMLNLLKKPD